MICGARRSDTSKSEPGRCQPESRSWSLRWPTSAMPPPAARRRVTRPSYKQWLSQRNFVLCIFTGPFEIMSGSLTDRGEKTSLLYAKLTSGVTLRKWAVFVDGSSVSAKAFDAASLFVTVQVKAKQPLELAPLSQFSGSNECFFLLDRSYSDRAAQKKNCATNCKLLKHTSRPYTPVLYRPLFSPSMK